MFTVLGKCPNGSQHIITSCASQARGFPILTVRGFTGHSVDLYFKSIDFTFLIASDAEEEVFFYILPWWIPKKTKKQLHAVSSCSLFQWKSAYARQLWVIKKNYIHIYLEILSSFSISFIWFALIDWTKWGATREKSDTQPGERRFYRRPFTYLSIHIFIYTSIFMSYLSLYGKRGPALWCPIHCVLQTARTGVD